MNEINKKYQRIEVRGEERTLITTLNEEFYKDLPKHPVEIRTRKKRKWIVKDRLDPTIHAIFYARCIDEVLKKLFTPEYAFLNRGNGRTINVIE